MHFYTNKFFWNFFYNFLNKFFYIEKRKKQIKDRIIRDATSPFEEYEDEYYKPKRVSNFWNDNYTEYESNDDGNKIFY